ncbi:MAG TPA: condensation domain-containing protein, partial [Thermoanaerobaculia bacterium]|nr:condensation domain-containing protein [Thermoanaerobaculia bacterium]
MGKASVEAIFPLSPAQEGMLLQSLMAPESGIHIEQLICDIQGRLDLSVFRQAWQRAIERHAILRTGFAWKSQEEPLQVVLREVELPIEVQDLRGMPEPEQRKQVDARVAAERCQGFNMTKPPLMRVVLFRTGDETHRLVWTHHHILMDGWCRPLLLQEIFAGYRAIAEGRELQLSPVRSYRDYIAWLQRQDLHEAEAFWRRMLAGITGSTPLGREREGSPEGGQAYGQEKMSLPAAETESLSRLAREQRVTLNTLVQAAWALLLARFSGRRSVVFGVTVSGRPAELRGIELTVGLFINTLPLRFEVAPEPSLDSWLREVQTLNADLRQFEHTPAGRVREWCEVPAALPLFESLLVFENYSKPPADAPGPAGSTLEVNVGDFTAHGAQTSYPLTLLARPGDELGFELIYDASCFEAAVVARILRQLGEVLRGMVAAPSGTLGGLLGVIPESAIPDVRPRRSALRREGMPLVLPRTPMEEVVAGVWSQLLGIEPIGVHDHFFAIGGHSLVATQLVSRMRQAFQVDLPLRALFEAPTVAGLTEEIRRLKKEQKQGDYAAVELPRIVPDLAHRGEPFPLTDIQQAYWIGRQGIFELGGVATHLYREIEGEGIDLERFDRAWQRMIDRHDMLRAVVFEDGLQCILKDVPPYRTRVLDLRGKEPSEVEAALMAVREEMSHQVLPADRWPLFEIRAAVLDDGRVRLYLSFDLLIGDGWSFQILFAEFARFYDDPDLVLPALELSFRDYVLAERHLEETELYRRSEAYWRGRLAALPGAPGLPLAVNPAALGRPRFQRRSSYLPSADWRRLKGRATGLGLTPSGLLLTAYAEVLAVWSKGPSFTINLTLFNRLPLHPEVNQLIGDFTSLNLLAIEGANEGTFEARSRRIQEQLWEDLDHRFFSGVRVQRELARLVGNPTGAVMPVIFTSALPFTSTETRQETATAGGLSDGSTLGLTSVYGIGQTPQVWLDHQVAENHGNLVFSWDAVEDLFPAGLLDAMFEAYCGLLRRLSSEESAWSVPGGSLVPPAHL